MVVISQIKKTPEEKKEEELLRQGGTPESLESLMKQDEPASISPIEGEPAVLSSDSGKESFDKEIIAFAVMYISVKYLSKFFVMSRLP